MKPSLDATLIYLQKMAPYPRQLHGCLDVDFPLLLVHKYFSPMEIFFRQAVWVLRLHPLQILSAAQLLLSE